MTNMRKILIVNAGDVRDLIRHMRDGISFPLRLTDGTEIELVGGDPQTGEIGREFSQANELRVQV